MSVTKDNHEIKIDGHQVAVTGKTGPVHATWTLLLDGREVDRAKAAGDFNLRGEIPGGPAVEVAVHQSLVGPTKLIFRRDGEEVATTKGYVA
jgi:hypothetical protein